MFQRLKASIQAKPNYFQNIRICLNYSTQKSISNKIVKNVDEALAGFTNGDTLLIGGFKNCGVPHSLIGGIVKKNICNIKAVCLSAGSKDRGVASLITHNLVKRVVTSYVGDNFDLLVKFYSGALEVELSPMGSISEGLRAGGAGIAAFFTPSGLGTSVEKGGLPISYCKKFRSRFNVVKESPPLHKQIFNGREYILKRSITGDFGIAKAWKADPAGNLVFRKTARNINPSVLMASRVGVVEVEEIVPLGSLDPNFVHVPGIYVHRILLGDNLEKNEESRGMCVSNASPPNEAKKRIGQRVALEFEDGMHVYLGGGIPCLAAEYISDGINVTLHTENGMHGYGRYPTPENDDDLGMTDPSKEQTTANDAVLDFPQTFAMIRGGHLDLTVVGCLQVSQYGDIANWAIPGQSMKGMGGVMDLVSTHGTNVIAAMVHTNKNGTLKILADCSLPLTGRRVVDKIITEKCVFNVNEKGLILMEIAKDETIDSIKAATGCAFKVSKKLKPMILPVK